MVTGVVERLLLSTAVATLSISTPGWAEVTVIGEIALSSAQSDEYVIRELVTLYRTDPATYAASLGYLQQTRPYLVERFNRLTVQTPLPTTTRPAAAVRSATYAGAASGGSGALLALGALGLAAGAAGGGGGSGTAPRAFFETTEYNRNSGLAQINASTRYAAGGRGQGVKVAVLDGGIDTGNPEFSGRIDTANSLSFMGDGSIEDNEGHGTHVAGIIAGARNGSGTHGVAYESQLVIFNGIPDVTGENSSDDFYSGALTGAVTAGARFMNNSWVLGSETNPVVTIDEFSTSNQLSNFLGTATISAMNSAKAANLLSVFAAGNNGDANPSFLGAVHVLLPDYAGYFLSVVAVNDSNGIADFSNRCGTARDYCFAAPGVNIESTRLNGTASNNIETLSGTSMAAPHVTGAAALLLSQWPDLSAPAVTQILLDSATDLGAPGVDDIYGHGLLNVGAAVRPAGPVRIYEGTTTDGASTPLAGSPIRPRLPLTGALQSALSSREMMVADRYDRDYVTDMGTLIDPQEDGPTASLMVASVNSATGEQVASADGRGVAYGLTQGGVSAWFGEAAAVAEAAGIADHSALLEGGRMGQFGVSLGAGLDARLTAAFSDAGAGSGEAVSAGLYGSGPIRASFVVGQLTEQDQVLGTEFRGASGRNASASTRFVALGAGATLGGVVDVDVQAVFGETDFTQDGLIAAGRDMASTGGRLSISQAVPGLSGARIGLKVDLPIVVTQGSMTVDVPVARSSTSGGATAASVVRSREEVAFDSPQRPLDVALSFSLPIDETRDFGMQLEGGYRLAEGEESQPFVGIAFRRVF